MERRRFLSFGVFALGALSVLPTAFAREAAKPIHIGWLSFGRIDLFGPYVQSFRQGMSELGYAEGKDYVIDFRWVPEPSRLAETASNALRENPDVLVATCQYTSGTALKLGSQIPIVLAISSDPVGLGMAKTLARPGGNVTGVMTLSPEITAKRLELLKEMVPAATRVAAFHDPGDETSRLGLAAAERAAQALGIELVVLDATNDRAYTKTYAAIGATKVNATLMLPSQGVFFLDRRKLAAAALESRLPSSFPFYEFVQDGGLTSYGPDVRAMFHRSATYVDKIVKGANPGELPIEQPTRFELAINLKTAKALGITVPQSVLVRADKVIE